MKRISKKLRRRTHLDPLSTTPPTATHKQLFCQFQLEKDGAPILSTFGNGGILRVDKATLAKKEDSKP